MKKGFTLIELVGVIFILAIILLIVVPIINDNITKSKSNLSSEQIRQIESAARQWGMNNLSLKDNKPVNSIGSEIQFITISDLQKSGNLDDKAIIDPKTKKEANPETKICITYADNQFNYEFEGDC